jgi:hypothetical protein
VRLRSNFGCHSSFYFAFGVSTNIFEKPRAGFKIAVQSGFQGKNDPYSIAIT